MVNRLSNLAEFLEDESLPVWLKGELQAKREEIDAALEAGQPFVLTGPNGETVTIAPKQVAAVA
jgi:hypothetical protein